MPKSLADLISKKAEALVGAPDDFDSLVDSIGDARFVLLGEASHGTHEFYRIRAQISKLLIEQRGQSQQESSCRGCSTSSNR
jgi:erythromycin esterase-like protein